MTDKLILDACCGPRMFWFDKENPLVAFMDKRSEDFTACDGRSISVRPDLLGDFRNMEFEDNTFKLVVFDPPHDPYAGTGSYTAQKYGKLDKASWKTDLKAGFDECMRVLEPFGIMIFKWNEMRIPTSEIIAVFGKEPLFDHKSGRASKTHWLCYMKTETPQTP